MNRFSTILAETGDRLARPKAARSRILAEIEADLQDLFDAYLKRGMTEDEAESRALEMIDLSDETLGELVHIHYDADDWVERILMRPQPFWEQAAMVVIVLFMLILVVSGLNTRLLSQTSFFIWPVVLIFILLVADGFSLLRKFSARAPLRELRSGLATPLFLGVASLVVGFGGFAIDLRRGFMRMAADVEASGPIFARAIFGGTSTLMFALLVFLCAAVVWFVAAGRVARLERAAARKFQEVQP